jgi:hypothetical protein
MMQNEKLFQIVKKMMQNEKLLNAFHSNRAKEA